MKSQQWHVKPCDHPDGKISGGCSLCRWSTHALSFQAFIDLLDAHACVVPSPSPRLKSLLREVDEALAPTNARKFDGDNNYKKCVDIRTSIVGADDGSPEFVLSARSPRSAVNDLGSSLHWDTNDRAEAADFLRKLADKIEAGGAS